MILSSALPPEVRRFSSHREVESKKLTGIRVGSIVLTSQHVEFFRAHKLYHEDNGLVPPGYLSALEPHNDMTSLRSLDEKPSVNGMMESAARNV